MKGGPQFGLTQATFSAPRTTSDTKDGSDHKRHEERFKPQRTQRLAGLVGPKTGDTEVHAFVFFVVFVIFVVRPWTVRGSYGLRTEGSASGGTPGSSSRSKSDGGRKERRWIGE